MGDIYIIMDKPTENSFFRDDLYEIGDFLKPYLEGNEDSLSIRERVKAVVRRLDERLALYE
jgi:hypothetical protein